MMDSMRSLLRSLPVTAVLLLALAAILSLIPSEHGAPLASAVQRTVRSPSEGPNVLVVLADDLGVDAVPMLGLDPLTPRGLMPNVDLLATRGVSFTQAWANPLCSPTRATLLTGLLPSRTGIGTVIESAPYSLPPELVTLPEALREFGPHEMSVAFFGKWHLEARSSPLDCAPTEVYGFDHYDGHGLAVGPCYQAWTRVTYDADPETVSQGGSAVESRYTTECMFTSAAEWIAAQDRTWLCVLAPEAPYHFPHLPPNDDRQLELCERTDRGCWDQMLSDFDTRLGELVASLGPDWEEHTTIVFTGDNGTPNNVNRYWPEGRAKGTPWQGGLRVPLVIAGRAVDPARRGAISEELVHVGDLYRTVASALDVPRLPDHIGLDSFDLGPALRFPPAPVGREFLISERFRPNGRPPYSHHIVIVRDRRYKLHWNASGGRPLGLFDLLRDPLEGHDLLLDAGAFEPQAERALGALTRMARSMSSSGS